MAPPSTGTLVSSGPIGTDVLMNKVAPSEARRTGSMRPVAMTTGLLSVVSPVLDDASAPPSAPVAFRDSRSTLPEHDATIDSVSQDNGEKSRMIGICCGNRA